MAEIYKRNAKWAYRVNYRDRDGKRKSVSKSGFSLKREAEIAALEVERKKARNGALDKESFTIADYFEYWLDLYKYGKHSQVTEARYPLVLKTIQQYFPNTKLKDITKSDYQHFLNEYSKGETHQRSKITVRKTNGYIRSMADAAIDDQIIFSNFTHNAVISGSEGKKESEKFMQLDELKQLKELLLNELDFKAIGKHIILTGLLTGARYSELVGLTWDDIDFKERKLSIDKTWDYKFYTGFKPTKNQSSIRTIDINKELVDILKTLKQTQQEYYLLHGYRDEFNLVFRNNRFEVPSNSAVNKLLKSIEGRLNFDTNYTFHSLRHSHVSFLISQGIDIFYISKRIGHKDISVTQRVYSHLLDITSKKEANKAIDALTSL